MATIGTKVVDVSSVEKELNDKLIDEYKKEMTMKDIEKMMNIS